MIAKSWPAVLPLLAALAAGSPAAAGGTPTRVELAGNPLTLYPFFEHVRAFNQGSSLRIAVDPGMHPALVGVNANIHVVATKKVADWISNPTLNDLTGTVENVTFAAGTIQSNTFVVDAGALSGNAGIELGVGYDIVIDVNLNGQLDAADYIDGYSDTEAGAYVCADTAAPGPLAVTEITYDLSGAAFDAQNVFYPTNIATMGKLPLIVVSHGNGHNYQWYDHIGNHMASRGYVVMSHENNTVPGVESAATTTLSNTEAFLANLATIGGGVLFDHVDKRRMTWIGHSRGGEGVVIAYDRIFDGTYSPVNFTIGDIKLVSSIAPVDFQKLPNTDPHGVNYHLWTGGSDSDVNGCASCDLCQTFHLHERATGFRQSISLHGVGHGDFHNGTGGAFATGPCLVGRPDTHKIVKGYLFPLVERYIDGNVPAKDFLTRQWESFRPIGAPNTNVCVTVDLMYRDGAAPGRIVIDDYQSNPGLNASSLGVPVTFTVTGVTEGAYDDPNADFTHNATQPMNGMTLNGDGADDSAGIVFEWNGANAYYAYFDPGAVGVPLNLWKVLSFRAAQAARHPNTTAALGDLTFDVTLVDVNSVTSRINIGAYGGGIEEPYQRTSCGTGAGWANEFETIRIPIQAFATNASGIDLSKIVVIGFEFGPGHGSAVGRIGLDQVELLLD
ncbi:MAG: hypothetical protein FJ299_08075 [Planctomycetes bacterium]|nr:hypothetical protein [Planctomycetota bacterium]